MNLPLPGPTLDYDVVDVFTDTPFAGNPLAVVHGADDLGPDQLQSLASEFHLSETAFVLPATTPGADYRLRIFTPSTELPFAGHPSIGAAWVLHTRGDLPAGDRVQQCALGPVGLHVSADGPVSLSAARLRAGAPLDPAAVAAVLGLSPGDLDRSAGPGSADAGLRFGFAALVRGALDRIRVDAAALDRLRDAAGRPVRGLFAGELPVGGLPAARTVSTRDGGTGDGGTGDGGTGAPVVRARVFVPGAGVDEDPATGSAALALGAWLASTGLAGPDATTAYIVRQGEHLARPSTLACEVTVTAGTPTRVRVQGEVVAVAGGHIRVPAPR